MGAATAFGATREYGNPRERMTIGYGRQQISLPNLIRQQLRIHISFV
jgi:hypothetical protein